MQPPTKSRVRALLADGEPMMLQGISIVLAQNPSVEVVATSLSIDEAFDTARNIEPDVLVHELSFVRRSGIDLARDIIAAGLPTACVAFTRLPATYYAEHYLRAGGRGFVPKTDPIESLIRCIGVVSAGGLFVSESEAGGVLDRLTNPSEPTARPPLLRLSTSEFQVLQLIAQGMGNREIAGVLHRSAKTVETYRSRMKKKLGLNNGTELAQFAALHLREADLPMPSGGNSPTKSNSSASVS